eukprot:12539557-Alexandrium_andersonii.AAC.1
MGTPAAAASFGAADSAANGGDEPMVWAWVPVAHVRDLRARALSFGGVAGPCDLCGAAVAAGAMACPACVATLRLVRALGLSGRRLTASQRDWVSRSLIILSEMVEA